MRTSIASLTLMTSLCILATNASAVFVPCPETQTIQCKAPSKVENHEPTLYQTKCSSEGWKGVVLSGDKDFVPAFNGKPIAALDGFLNPVCNYGDGHDQYTMFMNASYHNKDCRVSEDQKGFECP